MVYLIAFVVPALIWFISTATAGIFPFGGNVIFTSDMAYQYAGYFEYIQKILTEGTGAFFSLYKGLGEETLGVISYYMLSPFNLILALFPAKNITEAVLIINLLKIGASGLTFSIFIKNKFKKYNNNPFAVVAFSSCYALMAYSIAYQFNIMWLDGVVWLPLIILGIDRIIHKDRADLFYISLLIALISNWYIGFMICVFSCFYVVYNLILCDDVKLVKQTLKKFILFGILSAGTALVVIIPAIFTCFSEFKRTNILDEGIVNYTLIDIISKFVIGGFDFYQITSESISKDYLNLPNLFAGTGVLILFVMYFFNKAIDKREKKLDGIFGIVLIAMTLFMPLNRVWHVFTYNVWFPYRYSFCLTFYMIYVAYKSFLKINDMELKDIWEIFFVLLGVYFVIEKLNYTYIMSELIYCTMFILFAFCISLKLIKNNEKNCYLLLALIMCVECFVNTAVYMQNFSYTDRNKFYADRAKLSEKLANIPEEDKYYRMENDFVEDYNEALGLEYMGVTSSSTMGKDSSRGLLETLGFTRVVGNSVEYSPTTKFSDNFLGVKYYITDEVKINNDALSLGFTVNSSIKDIKDFITKWGEHSNSFEKQNELVKKATGINENLYNPLKIFDIKMENLEETEANKYKKIYPGMKALYSFKIITQSENEVYLKVRGNTLKRAKLYVNGEELCEYMTNDNYSTIKIGEFEKYEKVSIDIEFIDADYIELSDIWVYYEDIDTYKKIMAELKNGQLDIKNMTSDKIEGKIIVNKDHQLLMFTVPYDRNLKVYIDGVQTETVCVLDSLLSVPVTKGEHDIKVIYRPDHFIIALVASSVFMIISIILLLLERRKKDVVDD